MKLQQCALELIQNGFVKSAHDVADGGLIISLIESAIVGNEKFGFDVDIALNRIPLYKILFGEDQSRIVISADEKDEAKLKSICAQFDVPFSRIGRVTSKPTAVINNELAVDMEKANDLYFNAIHRKVYQN